MDFINYLSELWQHPAVKLLVGVVSFALTVVGGLLTIRARLKGSARNARKIVPKVPDYFDPAVPEAKYCYGRGSELETIRRHFFSNHADDPSAARAAAPPADARRVLIRASGGFGKTTLAAKFARNHKPYFAGVWWIKSEYPRALLAKVDAIAGGGKRETPPTLQAGNDLERASTAISDRFKGTKAPYLLVFDNVSEGTEGLVRRLVAALPDNVRVLMTARREDWQPDAMVVSLKELHLKDAAEFLRERAGRKSDEKGSELLAEELGRMPLALDHAAATCRKRGISFEAYSKDIAEGLKVAPRDAEYGKSVQATVTESLRLALELGGDNARDLAVYLAYCASERIPRSLYEKALDSPKHVNAAVEVLRDVALVDDDQAFGGDAALSMHRLVQLIVRNDPANGPQRGAAAVSRLLPAVCDLLVPNPSSQSVDNDTRLEKYFAHFLRVLQHLDEPALRAGDIGDHLDDAVKQVVQDLASYVEASAEGGALNNELRAHLPRLLGYFYEVDPLGKPLRAILKDLGIPSPEWNAFRDGCLAQNNYVLRFALADALAERALESTGGAAMGEIETLVRMDALNHFELGGYALKSMYSADKSRINEDLLSRLPEHRCYPGRSILGDLMLNLVYQGERPSLLLPIDKGENHRFWRPIWKFVGYDVNAVRAAEHVNFDAPIPAEAEQDTGEELKYLELLKDWQTDLLGRLSDAPEVSAIVENYLAIGKEPDTITDASEAFGKLELPVLTDVLRLLFGHPLWSVAEAAASVVAGLLHEADTDKGKQAYLSAITSLFDPNLPWRVRYGAMEAAYQIRLNETPVMATFGSGVKLFYNDRISKLRGLCAENLFSVMLNASDRHRVEMEAEFDVQIRHWFKDDDCWVLEHIHRYFHALARRGVTESRFGDAEVSELYADLDKWWDIGRETFLTHIEARKEQLAAPRVAA